MDFLQLNAAIEEVPAGTLSRDPATPGPGLKPCFFCFQNPFG